MTYSIITINYNNKEGLRKTIESVVNQTYKDFEYIVIDGGSTDGSKEVILEYSYCVNYWVSEKDKGIYNAMNKGISVAHGDYLNFMNSGDVFFNNNVLTDVLPYLNTAIVVGKLYKIRYKKYSSTPQTNPTMMLFYEGSLDHQACFTHKKLFNSPNDFYDENYKIVADWKFYMKKVIFENQSISIIPIVIATYEGDGISENPTFDFVHQRERKAILEKTLPPRILADYERYSMKESPMLDLIPQFNRTYRLEKFIVWVVKSILKLYHLFINFKA